MSQSGELHPTSQGSRGRRPGWRLGIWDDGEPLGSSEIVCCIQQACHSIETLSVDQDEWTSTPEGWQIAILGAASLVDLKVHEQSFACHFQIALQALTQLLDLPDNKLIKFQTSWKKASKQNIATLQSILRMETTKLQ